MPKEQSILNKIKSKYILQKIFTFAFYDTDSIFKLVKYNKNLTKRLDLNIKKYFEYKINVIINKIDIGKIEEFFECEHFLIC